MSWSEDTRCLYCEGRLPLYRKITHGQFCSSAHGKAYWEEHERLAVERLHQTHSSLRSYRSASHQEIHQQEVQQEAYPEAAPYPDLEPVTQVRVATNHELETDLELDPVPSFDVNLYPIPDMGEPPIAASELLSLLAPDFLGLGGGSPELVAPDPFECEITRQPLPPARTWSGPGTSLLPEGPPLAVWSHLEPSALNVKQTPGIADVADDYEGELCHPRSGQPAAGMRAAGRVELPITVGLEARRSAAPVSNLRVLEMEPAPVTSVQLEVPLQSDVLLQLLDQQVPHPDRLHALGQFAASQGAWVSGPSCPPFNVFVQTILPAASVPTAAGYEPSAAEALLKLQTNVQAAQGTVVRPIVISEIAINPQPVASAMLPTAESSHQMEMAELRSLGSTLSRPAQAALARHTTGFPALDLSAGVSSDVTYPHLTPVVANVEAPLFDRVLPLTFARKRKAARDVSRVELLARSLPQAVEIHPVFPNSGLEPLDRKPPVDTIREPESAISSLMRGEGLKKLEPAWAHATGFWHHAPRDLKLLLFAIPALLALVFHPGWPRVAFAAPQTAGGFTGNVTRALSNEWVNVRQTLENRAAVALDEDFRSGLDNWSSPGGSTTEWSFDQTGFVRPGPLALYRPSVGLTDYQVQFLGLIDKKALSWVVRAADFENFYVVKLAVVKPGPMPVIGLTRYAVIQGKARDRHDVNISLDARADTLYRVRMDVQGSDFTVEVQGQIADSWTETRLPRGGIGFFTASGEASRLRWVQITHQYDMLGRLCAYLAPYDTTNGSWQP